MARKSLYRVWRPEKFSDVVGQNHIVKVLIGEIENDRISHAYLFCGPRGTGKTSLAKIFAKSVNCTSRSGAESCGICDICTEAAAGNATDIIEIDAASNNGVDSVRDLRDRVNLLPAKCRYKVYIIDEVHMLSQGAFNALLKTLEEPPAHVIFILATTEPHKLPATIRSRCQRFDFKRISADIIAGRLMDVCKAEGFKYDKNAIMTIARAAEGGMRDALSILDQCSAFGDITSESVSDTLGGGDNSMVFELVQSISEYDEKRALERLRALLDSGADTRTLIKDLADIFRRMMWIASGSDVEEPDKKLSPLVESFGKSSCLRALNILIKKEYEMRLNLRSDIVLETAVMSLMCPEDDPDPSESSRIEKLESRLKQLEEQGVRIVEIAEPKASSERQPSQKAAKTKPVKKENVPASDDIWPKLLDAIKNDESTQFIYPFAQKASAAFCKENRLEVHYSTENMIAADYIKGQKAQEKLLNKLEEISGLSLTISVVVDEKKENMDENMDILDMFSDIEEI